MRKHSQVSITGGFPVPLILHECNITPVAKLAVVIVLHIYTCKVWIVSTCTVSLRNALLSEYPLALTEP